MRTKLKELYTYFLETVYNFPNEKFIYGVFKPMVL